MLLTVTLPIYILKQLSLSDLNYCMQMITNTIEFAMFAMGFSWIQLNVSSRKPKMVCVFSVPECPYANKFKFWSLSKHFKSGSTNSSKMAFVFTLGPNISSIFRKQYQIFFSNWFQNWRIHFCLLYVDWFFHYDSEKYSNCIVNYGLKTYRIGSNVCDKKFCIRQLCSAR